MTLSPWRYLTLLALVLSPMHALASSGTIEQAQAEIEAAMSSMGASIYTNLPKIDLSTWTNYDSGADMPDM